MSGLIVSVFSAISSTLHHWTVVGYVVQNVLQYVHPTEDNKPSM